MATNHDVWDAVDQTDGTPGNSFEFLLRAQQGRAGAYLQSADITNVAPAFTGKKRARQTYGAKGVDLSNTYARNLVLTFDVEVVRGDNGEFQPFLQDLLDASKEVGALNRRRIQAFDALGADYAFQSDFTIEHARANTGWDDASFFTITAEQYTPTEWITNPVLVGNVPANLAVSPATAAGGATVYIQGENLADVTGAASVKFGVTNATSYTVISDTLISAVVPGTGAADLPITVTNPDGAGEPIPFARTA